MLWVPLAEAAVAAPGVISPESMLLLASRRDSRLALASNGLLKRKTWWWPRITRLPVVRCRRDVTFGGKGGKGEGEEGMVCGFLALCVIHLTQTHQLAVDVDFARRGARPNVDGAIIVLKNAVLGLDAFATELNVLPLRCVVLAGSVGERRREGEGKRLGRCVSKKNTKWDLSKTTHTL